MNSPTKDLKDYLIDNTSLVFGTDLFISKLPEKDGNIICLIDTGGQEAEPNNIYNPSMQLLARGNIGDYESVYSLLFDVVYSLHELANITINGTTYIVVWKTTSIISLGEDKKGRPMLSCNMRIKRT